MRWLALILLLSLAGCTDPGPLPIDPAPAMGVSHWTKEFEVDTSAGGFQTDLDSNPPQVDPLFRVPENATGSALSLHVTPASENTAPFFWSLVCDLNGADCGDGLASGEDAPPFDIHLDGLQLPPNGIVYFWSDRDPGHPNSLDSYSIDLHGAVTFAGGPARPMQTVTHGVDFTAHTGPCVYFAEENCMAVGPSGTGTPVGPWPGEVVGFNFTAEWSAPAGHPGVQLAVRCRPTDDSECFSDKVWFVEGPSPLRLEVKGISVEPASLRVALTGPLATVGVGTRTEVHVTGMVTTRTLA